MSPSLDELIDLLSEVMKLASRAPSSRQGQLAARAIRRISRELAPFATPPHVTYPQNETLEYQNADKIHIGCGRYHISEFLNIDIFPPADLIFDIRAGLPFQTNMASIIFSEHALEHVDFDFSFPYIISECHRVLQEGGELIIGVPDAERAVRAFSNNDEFYFNEIRKRWYSNRRLLDIYRDNFDILSLVFHDEFSHEKYNSHYWGYSYRSLEIIMLSCGFKTVEKLRLLPSYANKERSFGTLYVKAIK